jgi:hypothetical protein
MTAMKTNKKALGVYALFAVAAIGVALAAVPIKGSIIDALTGFTVNGAAPSGQALCGNGTVGVYASSCAIHAASADSISGGTLVDVTSSRAIGTTYTNSGAAPLYVSGYVATGVGGDDSQVNCIVNGIKVWSNQANATVVGFHDAFTCMVPPSGTYEITTEGSETGFSLGLWSEFTF